MAGRTPQNDAHRGQVGSHDGSLEERWRWAISDPDVDGAGLTYSSPVSRDGTLFVDVSGTHERPDGEDGYVNRVVAVDAADSTTLWTHEYEPARAGVEYQSVTAAPVVVEDAVVVTGVDRLFTLDAASGERRWSLDLPGSAEGPPVAGDGTLFLNWRRDRKRRVVAVDVAEPGVRWESEPWVSRFAGVAVTDDVVVVPTTEAVVARDRSDGSELWRAEPELGPADRDLDGAPSWPYTPLVDGDTAYVAAGFRAFRSRDVGALVALDLSDGTVRWQFRPETASEALAGVYGRPLAAEDALYVAGGTRRDAPGTEFEPELYGVDPADGSLRSRVSAGVGLNPVGAGDTGYLATETGVHAFATGDGEPAGSHRFEDHSLLPAVSPGAIVGDLVVHPTWRGLLALGPS